MSSNEKLLFKKTLISTAVSASLLVSAPAVQAVLLTADATYQIPTDAFSGTNTDSNTTDVSASINSPASAEGYASATGAGNDTGWMYTTAKGGGDFLAQGHIQQSLTVTNITGRAQRYSLAFDISQGSLTTSAGSYVFGAGEYVQAQHNVSIKVNGAELFSSDALLRNDTSGVSFTQTGTALGTYTPGAENFSWNSYSDILTLGIFNTGQTFTLAYDIFTTVDGMADITACASGGVIDGGYGEVGYGAGCAIPYTYSQFGDPFNVNATYPGVISVSSVDVSVPEPGTMLLLGGGLAGLAFRRRRRERNNRS